MLKPLPDYSYNPELKELAQTIQHEIINANPNIRFKDIVGLDQAKRLLKEAVLMPMRACLASSPLIYSLSHRAPF